MYEVELKPTVMIIMVPQNVISCFKGIQFMKAEGWYYWEGREEVGLVGGAREGHEEYKQTTMI